MMPASNEFDLPEISLKLERVLLVDDVSINREILRSFLETSVRRMDEAADGFEALELFKQNRYDAILLDIEMPRLDGYATLRAMRAWEGERKLSPALILAITTSDCPEDEQRAQASGATAYLAKPVKKRNLLRLLHIHHEAPQAAHPMASLFPKLFVYAGNALDEIEADGHADLEGFLKRLHELRGAMATYGFEDFSDRLKLMQMMALEGKHPGPAAFDELRRELRRLQGLTPSGN
jgi:CheY-like chemotaxis protein